MFLLLQSRAVMLSAPLFSESCTLLIEEQTTDMANCLNNSKFINMIPQKVVRGCFGIISANLTSTLQGVLVTIWPALATVFTSLT